MKKIIPCLDVKEGRVVKGVKFVGLKDIGDPVEFAKFYSQQGADQLVMLDITKTEEGHNFMLETIKNVSEAIDIPLSIGGGIGSIEDIEAVLNAGAARASINSAAVSNPDLIDEASQKFGSDSLTIALDVSYDEAAGDYYVYTKGGKQKEDLKAFDWIKECEKRGAGSLLITSIDHDGVKEGFDIPFLEKAAKEVGISITASGGAGDIQDFIDLFSETEVDSGLAASIFHNNEVKIPELKQKLTDNKIEVDLNEN